MYLAKTRQLSDSFFLETSYFVVGRRHAFVVGNSCFKDQKISLTPIYNTFCSSYSVADFKRNQVKSTHWKVILWKVILWIGLDGFCWQLSVWISTTDPWRVEAAGANHLEELLRVTEAGREFSGWKSRAGRDSVMDGYGWTYHSYWWLVLLMSFFLCCYFFSLGGQGQCVWFQLFLRAILLTAAQKSERNFVTRNAHICSAVHGCLKLEVACHVSTSHKKNDYHIPYWQNKISSISIGKVQVTFQVSSVSSRHCFASEANQYDHYHHQ